MRIIKFAGIFLLVAGILVGSIAYVNREAFKTVFVNRESIAEGSEWISKTYSVEGLIEYISLHPEQVSLVSIPAGNPTEGFYFGADIPRVYGSAGIPVLLGEFYRQVSLHLLNPDSLVDIRSIGAFVIDGIDENSYRIAVKEAERAGYITPGGKIRLEDLFYLNLVKGNVHAHDYLLMLLGRKNISHLIEAEGLIMDPPIPFTGLYIMSFAGLFEHPEENRLNYLENLEPGQIEDMAWDLTEKYVANHIFREEVNQISERNGLKLTFIEMKRLYHLLPKIRPAELALILTSVSEGKFVSPSVSEKVFHKLKWPENRAVINNSMDYYAAAYDNRMGMLNGVDIGRRTGAETGRIQVVMFQHLPVAMWMHMSSNFINQELQRMLITDPVFLKEISRLNQDIPAFEDAASQVNSHRETAHRNKLSDDVNATTQ
jgi:hypothetical protein